MNVLMQREMEGDVASGLGDKILSYILFGIVSLLMMWILGPRVIGLFGAGSMNQFVSIMSLLIAFGSMSGKLESDHTDRQMSFLQTLPVNKSQIVHAKFLHLLLIWSFTFVWLSVVVFVNLLINGSWTLEAWTHVWGFVAAFLLIGTMVLLRYFWRGYKDLKAVFYLSAAVWAIPLGLTAGTGLSGSQVWGLAFIIAVILYLFCWWLTVRRVNTKGFPEENSTNSSTEEVS